jgi:hypothetical protein
MQAQVKKLKDYCKIVQQEQIPGIVVKYLRTNISLSFFPPLVKQLLRLVY